MEKTAEKRDYTGRSVPKVPALPLNHRCRCATDSFVEGKRESR